MAIIHSPYYRLTRIPFMSQSNQFTNHDIPLERDGFLRELLHHLSGTLQDVIGVDQASGFISVVGQKMGDTLNEHYRSVANVNSLSREQIADVLVDLKRRIKGQFDIVSQDDNKIVLTNTRCPFQDKVLNRPSLCMMTSNVFGTIAAENIGYAKVTIDKAIARGDQECHVTLYLNESDEALAANGNAYFKS